MIFEQIQLEMDCYAKTKELACGSEYASKSALVTDIATDVSTSEQIAERYADHVLPTFDVGYCYFPGDTSLFYGFNKGDLNMMIVKNPGLSEYVVDNSINIKEEDPTVSAIYLSYIYPQHQDIFNNYPYQYFTKDNIVRSPFNPLDWEYDALNQRWVLKTADLADLYRDPSVANSISAVTTATEWRNYTFLYTVDGSISAGDQTLLEGKGAEFQDKP